MAISALGSLSQVRPSEAEPLSECIQAGIANLPSELGLVTHYISEAKVEDVLRALHSLEQPDYQSISTTITSAAPQSPDSSGGSVVKGDIRRFLDKAFGKATLKEVYQTLAGAEQDESLSADVKKWAKEQQDFMDQRSPTGMAVAFESFRRAKKTKKLDEVLKNGESSGYDSYLRVQI
jgi:3-hydroxyisobutyryl-CoA hydrolase